MGKRKIEENYETIIIGGGIVGAGIARDLALHKNKVLLVEKYTFGSQTSSASSKMLHGGIRYLENFDFSLVFEALREKNLWLKNASDFAYEETFVLPVYKHSKWPLFLMRIGLFLYDLLSLFKNKPHQIINSSKTQKVIPGINPKGLRGAGIYSDSVVDDHGLTKAIVESSIEQGADALEGYEVISISKNKNELFEVVIKSTKDKTTKVLKSLNVVSSVGPFTDQLMAKLDVKNWNSIIMPSRGAHIWIDSKKLPLEQSMVIQSKDNRVIFVIPQTKGVLIGTTEEVMSDEENFFNLKITKSETDYLLKNINEYFPTNKIEETDIIDSFAGVRPLVRKKGHNSQKTSRHHKIYKPQNNFYVIAGGKYTTFRVMAADVAREIIKNSGKKYDKELSKLPLEQLIKSAR